MSAGRTLTGLPGAAAFPLGFKALSTAFLDKKNGSAQRCAARNVRRPLQSSQIRP